MEAGKRKTRIAGRAGRVLFVYVLVACLLGMAMPVRSAQANPEDADGQVQALTEENTGGDEGMPEGADDAPDDGAPPQEEEPQPNVEEEEPQPNAEEDGAALSGLVWLDKNANGIREENEPGVAGVVAALQQLQQDGVWQEVAFSEPAGPTGQDGAYRFAGLEDGTYRVVLRLSADHAQALELSPYNNDYTDITETPEVPGGEWWLSSVAFSLAAGEQAAGEQADAPDCALQTIEENPTPILRADEEVVVRVSTFAQLRTVLTDTLNQYGDNVYIYLTQNITGEYGGFTINTNKETVTLDGSPVAGSRVTFTEYNSYYEADAISVPASTNLTVKNLMISGHNYYGTFYSEADPGPSITYDNVSYTGPQPFYNRYGSITAHNMTAELTSNASVSQVQEFAEVTNLTLSGTVNISRTAAAAQTIWGTPLAIFYTYGNARVVVAAGANVHISTTDYVFWNETANASLTVMEGAVMTVEAANGFVAAAAYSGYTSYAMQSITVQSEATLKVTQTGSTATALKKMLSVLNTLTVGSGATLDVRAAGSLPAIETTGTLSVTFTNPARVILFSPLGVMRQTGTAGNISLSATTQAVNLWASSIPQDSINSAPTYRWNKASLAAFTLGAGISPTAMTSILVTPPFTAQDPASAFTTTTFNLRTAQALVLGAFELSVDTLFMDDEAITGLAPANAALRIGYTSAGGGAGTMAATAAATGAYSTAVPPDGLLGDSEIDVLGHANYLNAEIRAPVLNMRTTLSATPDGITFKADDADAPVTLAIKLENMTDPIAASGIVGLEWFRVSATDMADYDAAFAAGYAAAAEADKGTDAGMAVDDPASNTGRTYEMPVGENGHYWVQVQYLDKNGESAYQVKSILIDQVYTPSAGNVMGIADGSGETLYSEPIPGTVGSGTLLVGVALDLHSTTSVLHSTADGTTAVSGTGAMLMVNAKDLGPLWTPTSQAVGFLVAGTAFEPVEFTYVLNALAITVQFDPQGGTPDELAPQYYMAGSTFEALPTVTKDDHHFFGWITQPTSGVEVRAGDALPAAWQAGSTQTLYARWEPVSQSLTITNSIVGAYANKTRVFTFTLYFADEDGAPLAADTQFTYAGGTIEGSGAQPPPGGVLTLDGGGTAAVALTDGQTVTIAGVSTTGSVRVVAEGAAGYTVSFIDSETGETTSAADTGVYAMTDDALVFDFTYTGDEVVPSGAFAGAEGLLLLLAPLGAAGAGALAVAARRRRAGGRRHG